MFALEFGFGHFARFCSLQSSQNSGQAKRRRLKVGCVDSDHVEVELLVSGLCTLAAVIPAAWSKRTYMSFQHIACRLARLLSSHPHVIQHANSEVTQTLKRVFI